MKLDDINNRVVVRGLICWNLPTKN